jgi:hypothetical protein
MLTKKLPPNQVTLLPLLQLWKVGDEHVRFSKAFGKEAFAQEWESLRDQLRSALGTHYKESPFGDRDFVLSDDYSFNWLQAGGITSTTALNPKFIAIVTNVLSASAHPMKWAASFSVEIDDWARTGEPLAGYFLVKSGRVYVASYKGYDHESLSGALVPSRGPLKPQR